MYATAPDLALATMAMIEALHTEGRTHLDNFVPLAVEVLRSNPSAWMSPEDVASAISTQFGMKVPAKAVESVLKRTVRAGSATRSDNKYQLSVGASEQIKNIKQEQATFLREQESLKNKLIEFARLNHEYSLDGDAAELALLAHIEQNTVALLSAQITGNTYAPDRIGTAGDAYVVADFIAHVVRADPVAYESLMRAARGSMLSAFLHLPNLGGVERRFESTSLYLDAPILLQIVGLEGPEAAGSALEIIRLAFSYGAGVKCFQHSIAEAEGVIAAAISAYQTSTSVPNRAQGVSAWAIRADVSVSELELRLAKFQDDLFRLRIQVVDSPDPIVGIEIDEAALTEALDQRIRYRYPAALRKDVASLRAMHLLRNYKSSSYIESCRAVLITDNESVARVAQFFFREYGYDWPICTLMTDLATILYLKAPQESPDLPHMQVIAGAYAALEPGSRIWNRWLEEIERANQMGSITPEDLTLLCHGRESRRVLMEYTRGVAENVNTETVQHVLERARERVRQPMLSEIDHLAASLERKEEREREYLEKLGVMKLEHVSAQNELSDLRESVASLQEDNALRQQKERLQIERIRNDAARSARRHLRIACLVVALVSCGIAAYVGFVTFFDPTRSRAGYIFPGAVFVLVATVGLVRHFVGGSVLDWIKPLEVPLGRYYTRKRMSLAGFAEEAALAEEDKGRLAGGSLT